MSTCFLHVPDPDDQPFDDDEPNKPIAPGDRWCSLWAPREPGGPRLPCHPSIEGTADKWLLIAGAIEAGAPRAFGRVAFAPAAGGGELWSPHNSTGDRDHVRLTTAELVELAADIRAKLAPPDRECGHQADQDRRDADAIVRVLHSGFLPALRAALDRAAPSPDPASHPSDITREAIIARAKALTAGPFLNYEIDDAPRPDGYGNLLIGPGGFRCDLGRYEGAPTWHKGGDDAVSRLGQLNVIVIELMNVIDGKV